MQRQKNKLIIGTRGSKLALAQALEVKNLLISHHDHLNDENIIVKVMSTRGDRVQDRNLSEIGGKGLFTEEIENALLEDEIDIAVHSLKDMPTILPEGLMLSCYLKREDTRDALISSVASSITELPHGAIVGTSSLRRKAQVLAIRPDLKIVNFRGNVQTRLKKLDDGVADATFLAVAGLNRLKINDERVFPIKPEIMLPAVAQGAITIETATDNDVMKSILAPLNHTETELAVRAERAMLHELDGSCRTPIAGLASIKDGVLTIRGRILEEDGTNDKCSSLSGDQNNPEETGRTLGRQIKCVSS